ncbi:hypothetical protein CLV84_0427 [Neolewinella xylanilytica]|uniref:TonB-like protein n=1 Tax=Neolewinella xylanilytica TaxID=1514080 RepID=A0A2S6I7K1_9BACT|nr:hypothetical protein [Neolewinella xylanilytica]PPK87484.1 hypothetical protein CLV84_0427 [Neolewinella xylanilytica]
MLKLGTSSGYFIFGGLLTAWLMLLYSGTVSVTIDEAVHPYSFVWDGSPAQHAMLSPPAEVTLPTVPSCKGEATYEDRFFCGVDRFFRFVHANKHDPEGSQAEDVIVAFTIEHTTGKITGIRVDQGEDVNNVLEAVRIVDLISRRYAGWTPGTVNGQPRDMELAFLIPFHGAGCAD